MKKLFGIIVLVLLLSGNAYAEKFICSEQGNNDYKVTINIKPLFGMKKSYSDIQIKNDATNKNISKEIIEVKDSFNPHIWTETFFNSNKNIYKTLIFEFYEKNLVNNLNIKINNRNSPLFDNAMHKNPDKEIYFNVCIPK